MDKLKVRTDETCTACGQEPILMSWTENALLIHGGYGEAVTITVAVCPCGTREVSRWSVNPRRCE